MDLLNRLEIDIGVNPGRLFSLLDLDGDGKVSIKAILATLYGISRVATGTAVVKNDMELQRCAYFTVAEIFRWDFDTPIPKRIII